MVLKNFEQYTVLVTFCGKDCSGKKLEAYKFGARKLSQNFLKDNQNFWKTIFKLRYLANHYLVFAFNFSYYRPIIHSRCTIDKVFRFARTLNLIAKIKKERTEFNIVLRKSSLVGFPPN